MDSKMAGSLLGDVHTYSISSLDYIGLGTKVCIFLESIWVWALFSKRPAFSARALKVIAVKIWQVSWELWGEISMGMELTWAWSIFIEVVDAICFIQIVCEAFAFIFYLKVIFCFLQTHICFSLNLNTFIWHYFHFYMLRFPSCSKIWHPEYNDIIC